MSHNLELHELRKRYKLWTCVCLQLSVLSKSEKKKSFLIISYWHSHGGLSDLSENDIFTSDIKGGEHHFPIQQMKRQMGKIKNSIWSEKHTFKYTLLVHLIPRVSDQTRSYEIY